MVTLATIGLVLICLLVVGLQHLFNYWIRQDMHDTPLPILGVFGILISLLVLGITIYNSILIFSNIK